MRLFNNLENAVDVLQRYRRDRHVLLGYMLSGSLIKKVVLPPGAVTLDDVDLDQVSVDHVLNCAKKGQILDLSEAIRDYYDSTLLPYVNDAVATSEFFMVTDPESSGSPPARVPPAVPLVTQSPIFPSLATLETIDCAESEDFESLSKSHPKTPQAQELTVDDIEDIDDDNDFDEVDYRKYFRRVLNDTADLVLALPSFATGITDGDLRETAFEILLAAAGASGGLIVPSKDKRKEKKSTLMRKLGRSKSEHVVNQSYQSSGLIGLLETMRVQMEISEGMDVRTRHALLNAMNGKVGKRMDTLLIPFELLCCISRTEFSDKKTYIKWQKRQLNLLEEGLINHPAVGFGESGRKSSALRALLAKIEESELLPSSTGEHQRAECLRSLREIAIPLAERPARGDLTGEVCHWADGYHLNVRLYEKLLLSVFDVLDEGKLTEEVEEILELLKSTWRILGITETIHYTCYAWVLFRQFVLTGETGILQHVIVQLKKVPLREQRGPQERLHLKSLLSSRVEGEKVSQETTFLESFLWPIQKWVDKLLGDYHFHYAEGLAMMESTLTVAMTVRRILSEEPEMAIEARPASDTELIESYVSSSIKSAYIKIVKDIEMISDTTLGHPLALLAEQMKELLKKDTTRYMPILSKWHSGATVISSSLIHKLYGLRLKPFLDGVEHLTEDAVEVLPAAELLEQYVMEVLMSTSNQGTMDAYYRKLHVYNVESVSGTLVLRWVNSQLGRLLGWVERAIKQEKWVPVSPQQRHGTSIVEVYRIVEETVYQFFALTVPMRQGELSSLCRGIDNAFQVYAEHIGGQSANKEDIIPPVPILTRYSRENGINALLKKEVKEHKLPVVRKSSEINVLTTPMLCVQLNTLHYAISQLDKLEDSIWERWTRKMLQNKSIRKHTDESLRISTSKKEIFNGCRQDINDTIDVLCEFTGTKIIFWDLREAFIENLYKPTVAQSRVELLIDSLDLVLNELCSIIAESLRDRVVTGLLQASLDGLLRVLLDGGPSRVFSRADAKLLEDDVEVLKEFFISGGDGLPRGVVENQIARVRHIIKLLGHETRDLIEDLKSASEMEVQGGRSKLGAADAKTLLRILCHRSDSEASQFVKKHYKIPKSTA